MSEKKSFNKKKTPSHALAFTFLFHIHTLMNLKQFNCVSIKNLMKSERKIIERLVPLNFHSFLVYH